MLSERADVSSIAEHYDFEKIAMELDLLNIQESDFHQLRNKLAVLNAKVNQIGWDLQKQKVEVPQSCPPAEKILIGITSVYGKPQIEVMASILGSQGVDFKFALVAISRDPYIDRARNALVTTFLESDATDLLFWDDDVGVDPWGFAKIAKAPYPFVAGVYPKKNEGPVTFPLDFFAGQQIIAQNGVIEVAMVPTGFLKLNRAVFDYMPYVEYQDQGRTIRGYFKTQLENGMFIGEDVAFCHIWRHLGGKIYCIPDIDFAHIGPKTYNGNLAKWLMENCSEKPSGVQSSPEENRERGRDFLESCRSYLGIGNAGGVQGSEEVQSAA